METEKGIGHHEKHRLYYSKAVKLYFTNGLGYVRISKIIPVSATTVKNWCITFAAENGITMEKKANEIRKRTTKTSASTEVPNDIKNLQAEVLRLQKELKQEKLRADAYDMMIDIAESRFNIPIRKKAGTRR